MIFCICRFLKRSPEYLVRIIILFSTLLMPPSYALSEPMNIRPNNQPLITGAPPGSFRASQDLSGTMGPYNDPNAFLKIEPMKAPPGSFRAAQDIQPEAQYLGKVGKRGQLYLYRRSYQGDPVNPDLERDRGGMTLRLKLPF